MQHATGIMLCALCPFSPKADGALLHWPRYKTPLERHGDKYPACHPGRHSRGRPPPSVFSSHRHQLSPSSAPTPPASPYHPPLLPGRLPLLILRHHRRTSLIRMPILAYCHGCLAPSLLLCRHRHIATRTPQVWGLCVSAVGAGEAVEERGASSCAPVMIQGGEGVTIQVGGIRAECAGRNTGGGAVTQ